MKHKLQEQKSYPKVRAFFRKLLLAIITIAILIGTGFYLAKKNISPEIITEIQEKVVTKNVGVALETKIRSLKDSLLDDLRHEEIKGYENNSLVIVFDPLEKDLAQCRRTGGVRLHCYSTGDYNFKIATVQHYYLKFYSEVLNDKEAMLIAMDDDLSRELAEKVIFDEVGGIWNWRNSAEKINAAQRIEFIRELEA